MIDLRYESNPKRSAISKRIGLFAPGGIVSTGILSRNHTVLVVNDTCFVHGGLRREHVEFGLDKLNKCVSAWMLGAPREEIDEALYLAALSPSSAVWCRRWSRENVPDQQSEATELRVVLAKISAEVGRPVNRMVMGHTVQRSGINSEFDDMAWRVDVGLSRGINGASPEALQILNDELTVLRAKENPSGEGIIPDKMGSGHSIRDRCRRVGMHGCDARLLLIAPQAA
eukprot:2363264-Pyramimonas_sp.AAC.1